MKIFREETIPTSSSATLQYKVNTSLEFLLAGGLEHISGGELQEVYTSILPFLHKYFFTV